MFNIQLIVLFVVNYKMYWYIKNENFLYMALDLIMNNGKF